MSGKPGTPHFGVNEDPFTADSTILQDGVAFKKDHFMLHPAQASRAMGSTEGDAPGCGWDKVPRMHDYSSNHDGYSAGNAHNINMDEQKVLQNTVYAAARFEYSDEQQNISGT